MGDKITDLGDREVANIQFGDGNTNFWSRSSENAQYTIINKNIFNTNPTIHIDIKYMDSLVINEDGSAIIHMKDNNETRQSGIDIEINDYNSFLAFIMNQNA